MKVEMLLNKGNKPNQMKVDMPLNKGNKPNQMKVDMPLNKGNKPVLIIFYKLTNYCIILFFL